MLIIPAIDLSGGRCVRLTQGRFEEETVYYDDPVQAALAWQAQGAQYLHVVDLDGARQGEPKNLDSLKRILQSVKIPVQFGGGIRTKEIATRILGMGLDRVILGTKVVDSPELVEELCKEYPGCIAISLDHKAGRIAVKGWLEVSEYALVDLARQIEKATPRAFIVTDISRDGTLQGPDTLPLKQLLQNIKTPVIASGGIASLEHLRTLSALGVEGAIVGKALYTGAVRLPEAIEACHT
ncbi:MAG TPA: 1-(5-phosphoribosyl)-5-[(5-phosphoribosylamino)methylideneamino]imidazole-4-carboxamide isomerase [Candidatus Hypogeohydataceae bacterium YC41]